MFLHVVTPFQSLKTAQLQTNFKISKFENTKGH